MKRGTPDHPKVYALAEVLGIRRPAVLGHLELLFHFAAQYAPQGDIGRFPDKRIAAALDWAGKPEKMIESLVATGWVDCDSRVRLVVHDWHEHADRTTLQRLSRKGKSPVHANHQVTEEVCTQSETKIRTLPEPEPEPVPAPHKDLAPPDGRTSAAETAAVFDLASETVDLGDSERAEAWNGNGTPKKSLLKPEIEVALTLAAGRIHTRHPAIRRCGRGEVKTQLRAIVRRAPPGKRLEVLRLVDENHAGWCATADWQKENGQYAKGLENWLAPTKGRWEESPPVLATRDGYRPVAEWDRAS